MWTKIAKVSLVLFMIGGFVYSIILGSTGDWALWWIMPIVWVLTFLSASVIGTVIEISEKASENQYMLDRLIGLVKNGGEEPVSGNSRGSLLKRLSSDSPNDGNAATPWRCPDCGEDNDKNAQYCKSCGRYR